MNTHGALAALENGGNLLGGESLKVTQHEDAALIRRQFGRDLSNRATEFAMLGFGIGKGAVVGRKSYCKNGILMSIQVVNRDSNSPQTY